MADQRPKHGPDISSLARVRETFSQIAGEIEDQPLRSSTLARIMRETFGGSDAGGACSFNTRLASCFTALPQRTPKPP